MRDKTYDELTLGASNPAVASTLWHGIQRTLVDIEDLRSALYATLGDEIRVDPQEGVIAGHIRVIAQLVESSVRVFGQDEEIKPTRYTGWRPRHLTRSRRCRTWRRASPVRSCACVN